MRIFGITGIHPTVLYILHPLLKLLERDVQRTTKIQGVKLCHFARHERDVVCRLVKNQQFTVTLVDSAARRILNLIKKSIAVRILLEIIRHDLQVKQTNHVKKEKDDRRHTYHIFPFLQRIILHTIVTYEL